MEQVMLIDPDGVESIIVEISFAREWCRLHDGWKWRRLTDEEKKKPE